MDKHDFAKRIGIIPNAMQNVIARSKEKRLLYYKSLVNSKLVLRHKS